MEDSIVIISNGKRINPLLYKCELQSYVEIESDPEVITYRSTRAIQTLYVDTRENPAILKIELLFYGKSQDEIKENAARLRTKLFNCEIEFSNERDKIYYCILNKSSHEFYSHDIASYTFEFSFDKFSSRKYIKIPNNKFEIIVGGAKETPISFDIYAKEQIENIHVNGFVIKSLSKGYILHIDSDKCLITANDVLHTKYVDFIEFPMALGKYEINYDSNKVDITVSYRERW